MLDILTEAIDESIMRDRCVTLVVDDFEPLHSDLMLECDDWVDSAPDVREYWGVREGEDGEAGDDWVVHLALKAVSA